MAERIRLLEQNIIRMNMSNNNLSEILHKLQLDLANLNDSVNMFRVSFVWGKFFEYL